jgi:hypothetical protein
LPPLPLSFKRCSRWRRPARLEPRARDQHAGGERIPPANFDRTLRGMLSDGPIEDALRAIPRGAISG